ncbi:MAG: MFS transporter [Pseudomonadota bacterium]
MQRTDLSFAITILSAANFVIGMGAFMVVGMLNPVAADLGLSPARAGWMMTIYALCYAVLSPVLVAVTGRVGRRRILAFGLLLFAAANAAASLVSGEAGLLAARGLAAAGAGLVTPVTAAVAANMAVPERQARALASVFFGLTLAQVLGVPVGSWVAYTFGWRWAFAIVALLAFPIAALIWTRIPAGMSVPPVTLSDLTRTLSNVRYLLTISFTAVFIGSIYVVYTYLAPLLSTHMNFGRDGIASVLLIFGAGAVIGNLAGGQLTDRIGATRTLLILTSSQAALLPWFSGLPLPLPGLTGLILLWSTSGWAFMAAQQVRLIALDPGNVSVLLALNAAAIYIGSAFGAFVGGFVIDAQGLDVLGWVASAGAIAAALVLVLANQLNRRATDKA